MTPNIQQVIRDLEECFPECKITVSVLQSDGKKDSFNCGPKQLSLLQRHQVALHKRTKN